MECHRSGQGNGGYRRLIEFVSSEDSWKKNQSLRNQPFKYSQGKETTIEQKKNPVTRCASSVNPFPKIRIQ